MVVFIYLMICLRLLIVPIMNNNDSNTLLDSLLFTASEKWDIDEQEIVEAMDKIAFHESKNIADAWQISDKSDTGYGPGRGLFQFEVSEKQGAHTAMNRLMHYYGNENTPEWLMSLANNNYDVSGLSPSQQQELFLANILQTPISDEELADFWAQYHHAGTKPGTDAYTNQRQKFIDDIQHYGK